MLLFLLLNKIFALSLLLIIYNNVMLRIKAILKEKGITAKECAKTLGMSEVGFGIAISDKGNPPLSRLQQIADALDVPITELFDDNRLTCPKCGARLKLVEE